MVAWEHQVVLMLPPKSGGESLLHISLEVRIAPRPYLHGLVGGWLIHCWLTASIQHYCCISQLLPPLLPFSICSPRRLVSLSFSLSLVGSAIETSNKIHVSKKQEVIERSPIYRSWGTRLNLTSISHCSLIWVMSWNS